MRILFTLIILLIATIGWTTTHETFPDPGDQGMIVWMHQRSSLNELKEIIPATIQEELSMKSLGFDLYHLSGSRIALTSAASLLAEHSRIRFAGSNPRATLRNTIPDDPQFNQQSFHQVIGSELAWDISTGGQSPGGHPIVVAIMDAGFDGSHEDIIDNLWINEQEIPDDGLDNDNNGYIDDYDGFNPRVENGDVPVHFHGHSVSGYIGAKGDNSIGVTGINWNIELMLIGPTTYADEWITAFRFLYDWRKRFNESNGNEGAYIAALNLSLGFENVFPSDIPWMCPLVDSLGDVGILMVGAAPNNAVDIGTVGDMPCACGSSQIICVTNTTADDDLVSNAGYSKTYIHLSAPGYNSYTVKLASQGYYGTFSGTSAATPMVTGALALLASMPCEQLEDQIFSDPKAAASLLRDALLSGTEPLAILENITATGGRLSLLSEDGGGAVNVLADLCGSAEGPLAILSTRPNPTDQEMTVFFRSRGSETFPLRVYNLLGQLVYEAEIDTIAFSEKTTSIPTGAWSPGMYIVIVGQDGRCDSRKVIVQH
ncbi:MAG: S8 family peptidase [Lewinellaceae bacterium]|nr:S8 family peptidase [Saprospiraceae bacterium]MCB9311689.1 S8 family peptidase [Lewinellaceae bacterium]